MATDYNNTLNLPKTEFPMRDAQEERGQTAVQPA